MNTRTLSESKLTTRTPSHNVPHHHSRSFKQEPWMEKVKAALYFVRHNAIGCDVLVRMMHDQPLTCGK